MKTSLLFIALAFASLANAQKLLYLEAGYNNARISNTGAPSRDSKSISSFHAGFTGRFGVSRHFDIETGLLFSGKGGVVSEGSPARVTSAFKPYYFELPLNAVVIASLGKKSTAFFGAGGYAAAGMRGTLSTETKTSVISAKSETSIKFDDSPPRNAIDNGINFERLKRFDYGLNFNIGFSVKRYLLKANYGVGLKKIHSSSDNKSTPDDRLRTLSVSAGFIL